MNRKFKPKILPPSFNGEHGYLEVRGRRTFSQSLGLKWANTVRNLGRNQSYQPEGSLVKKTAVILPIKVQIAVDIVWARIWAFFLGAKYSNPLPYSLSLLLLNYEINYT